MNKVHIIDELRCVDSYDDGKEWGSWEKTYEYSVEYAEIPLEGKEYDAYEVHGEWPDRSEVYVVVVRYGDGDTFGHSTGHGCIEAVFGNSADAEALASRVKQDPREENDYFSKEYKAYKEYRKSIGLENSYTPWDGYFNSIEGVEVHCVPVYSAIDSKERGTPTFTRKGY